MKCFEVDMLELMEGRGSADALAHLDNCRKCLEEFDRLRQFSAVLVSHYAAGREIDLELEKELSAISPSTVKRLPKTLQKKVDGLKSSSLADKLGRIVGTNGEQVQKLVDAMLRPKARALPASPKDLAKKRKKTEKDDQKKDDKA